jgi:tungstate transport system substrate-binding protein
MKKLLAILLILVTAFGLVACAGGGAVTSPSASQAASPSASAAPTPSPSAEASPSATPSAVPTPANPVIRLSTTTSVNDSGLLPYLQPYFETDTGYKLEISSAGTGAAIEKGKTGDADCLLVHAKSQEDQFVAEGYAKERIPFMYNYFVIIGPAADPAGIAKCTTAADAFKAIADTKSPFVSRGDNSGTNTAELKIWKAAGIEPKGDWYISSGQGMGPSITMAAEKQAYILTDKATYLAHEKKGELSLLMKESDDLKNTYSMLAVSPEKWPDTNIDGANAFIKWMTGDKAKDLITKYGVDKYGEGLFFVS